jgi:predicted SprT family Zn-dependent metalloprotease
MTNFEFMKAAEKEVAKCWATLMQKDNRVLPSPKVTFDLRGTTAGKAGSKLIRLNLGFVPVDGAKMLDQTIKHECVHAWLSAKGDPSHVGGAYNSSYGNGYADQFSVRRVRRQPHGDTFMRYLTFLGGEARRTHNYDASNIRTKTQHRWEYKCIGCGKVMTVTTCIHNKLMRGQVRFHTPCGSVNGRLERVY